MKPILALALLGLAASAIPEPAVFAPGAISTGE
jgi:hypothetical protein